MNENKLDQILEDVRSLKDGQQKNYDLIQKNGVKIEGLDSEIKAVKGDVQSNGIKIEQVGSDVKAVAEGHGIIRREMREMKIELKADIADVKSAFQYHARQPSHA